MSNTHVERRGECLCEEESLHPTTHRTIRWKTGCVPVYLYEWKSEDVYMRGVSAYVFNLLRWHLCERAQRCSPAYATAEDLADAFGDGTRLSTVARVGGSHMWRSFRTLFFGCEARHDPLQHVDAPGDIKIFCVSGPCEPKTPSEDVSSVVALNFLGPCVHQHTPTRTVPL